MTAPHDTDRFRHAATYTVAVTFTVAGAARPGAAHRRAQRAAERIAAAAARLSDVVEATATVGLTLGDGEVVNPRAVRFPGANTGPGLHGNPDKLARYLDPDHERALASLAEANARDRARRDADRERRRAVSCPNAHEFLSRGPAYCPCVYCQPDRHLDTLTGLASGLQFNIPALPVRPARPRPTPALSPASRPGTRRPRRRPRRPQADPTAPARSRAMTSLTPRHSSFRQHRSRKPRHWTILLSVPDAVPAGPPTRAMGPPRRRTAAVRAAVLPVVDLHASGTAP